MATTFCGPKPYTGAGDKGATCLCCLPKKVSKATPRVEAIGSIDELNSFIGLCRLHCKTTAIDKILEKTQQNLFRIGAGLAGFKGFRQKLNKTDVHKLEIVIDKYHRKLPVLNKFIFPRGSVLAAHLHVARTVCRRAERALVALGGKEKINPEVLRYVNRLSSLLFVLARWANKEAKIKEAEWRGV